MKKMYLCLALLTSFGFMHIKAIKSDVELLATAVLINTLSHIMLDNPLQACAVSFLVHNSYDVVTFHVPFIDSLKADASDAKKIPANHFFTTLATNVFGQSVGSVLGRKLKPLVYKCFKKPISVQEKSEVKSSPSEIIDLAVTE